MKVWMLATIAGVAVAAGAASRAPIAVVTYDGSRTHVVASADGRSWRDVTPPGRKLAADDATFLDARRGWVVSEDCASAQGEVARTADGGRTWRRTPFTSHTCNAGAGFVLDFVDASVGWVVQLEPTGPFARLYGTHDGGGTWRLVRDRLPDLGEVAFRTRTDGWLGGGSGLYRTTDGGRSWQRRIHGEFTAPAFSGRHGVVAALVADGRAYRVEALATADAGRTWRRILLSSRPLRLTRLPGVALSSPSPDVAWIVAFAGPPLLYRTSDGGRHWSEHRIEIGNLQAVDAIDGKTAVASTLSGDGSLFTTHNGGVSWQRVRP
jgi:photosystem II stability/assembly factor-like uncharacterized protein